MSDPGGTSSSRKTNEAREGETERETCCCCSKESKQKHKSTDREVPNAFLIRVRNRPHGLAAAATPAFARVLSCKWERGETQHGECVVAFMLGTPLTLFARAKESVCKRSAEFAMFVHILCLRDYFDTWCYKCKCVSMNIVINLCNVIMISIWNKRIKLLILKTSILNTIENDRDTH